MTDRQCDIVNRSEPGGVVRVRISGEVDMEVRGEVREAIEGAINAPGTARILVDIDQVTFLDSSGIASLVAGQHAAKRAGLRYGVVNPRGGVRRVLEIACVLTMLTEETA
jgi:anti-sigma B factor antagonist